MTDKVLGEAIQRAGIITREDLQKRTGAAHGLLLAPLFSLLENKEVVFSRFVHGKETFLSRHVMFCLQAVCTEPTLSADAQALYDALSDRENSMLDTLHAEVVLDKDDFTAALAELLGKYQIMPLGPGGGAVPPPGEPDAPLESYAGLLWATLDHWYTGLHKPARYASIDYCMSELRSILRYHFSTREINGLFFAYA